MQIFLFETILVLFLICVTAAVILDRDLFGCTILFCVFSFCAVLTYLVFGSPDVAFTEAVIGTMSTVFFAVALKKVDRRCRSDRQLLRDIRALKKHHTRHQINTVHLRRRIWDRCIKIVTFLALAFVCLGFCIGTKYLPEIGDPNSAPNTHISNYYIEHSKEDTAANNIVSGTLADYRGFDTMFETSVMFVSGLVVTLILFSGKEKYKALTDRYREKHHPDTTDEKKEDRS